MEGARAVYLLLCVVMVTQEVTSRNSVVGTIKENTTWVLKDLSVRPAMTAYLRFDIQYPVVAGRDRPIITFYYNGQNSPNLDGKCEQDLYGQLRNGDLAVPLNENYRKSRCYQEQNIMKCSMETRIQDWEPKSYRFSLCNKCGSTSGNLEGLYYNVTIYGESNKTSCVDLHREKGRQRIDRCQRYYQYAAIPNQIGNTDLEEAMFDLTQALDIEDRLIDLLTHTKCLKELYQIACLIVIPECLPEVNQVVLPCQEYCNAVLTDCLKIKEIKVLVDQFVFNCNYLPSKDNNATKCYTKFDVCGPPPEVKHGHLVGDRETAMGWKGEVVEYACAKHMHMYGKANSTCTPSGEWTEAPSCRSLSVLMIVGIGVGGFVFLVLLITMVTLVVKRYRKSHRGPLAEDTLGNDPSVNRSNDALVNGVQYEYE